MEQSESIKSIERELEALKADFGDNFSQVNNDCEGKVKLLEARIEDVAHKLQVGMNQLSVSTRVCLIKVNKIIY